MYEGTRYGPPQHARRDVQEPDAYHRFLDGKIKAPPAPGVHVIGWIGFSCRLPPHALLAQSSERPMVSLVAAPSRTSIPCQRDGE